MLVDAVNHRDRDGATETTVLGPFYVGEHKVIAARHRYLGEARRRADVRAEPRHRSERQAAGGRARRRLARRRRRLLRIRKGQTYATEGAVSRARFITDADGRFFFRTILPCSYPIPTDGPVGEMILQTRRHPNRPAHIHFLVNAPGHEPLITHVFIEGDKYLDSDVVFGVKDELISRSRSAPMRSCPTASRPTRPGT